MRGEVELNSSGMTVCIHRGTQQIGGTCVELAADGYRILLDLGMPLDAEEFSDELIPNVSGLRTPDPSLLGIVLSHGHADHWGLLRHVPADIPVYTGAATKRILAAAAPFVPFSYVPSLAGVLSDGEPITIGPFTVTPYLVDHSAYDAYALLIEAGGKRLFYTGDIRAHGRKSVLFERLVHFPPRDIDVLLMEGSSLGRLKEHEGFPSEAEIENDLTRSFAANGLVLVAASAQNIDRVVSLYRACKRTGRTLLLDIYAMEILRATGNPNIPQPGWPNLKVYIPRYQRVRIRKTQRFDLLTPYKEHRIYSEHMTELAPRTVMLFRAAMLPDLDRAEVWTGARAIWSQWDGYLKQESGERLRADLEARHVPLETIHTSGHASLGDLKRLAAAINPAALVPIHTFRGDDYVRHFANVMRRADGERWTV